MSAVHRPLGPPLGEVRRAHVVARRTHIPTPLAFAILVALSIALIVASSTPAVIEVRRAIATALRPVEGAIATVATAVNSAARTVTEMDRLRADNDALRADNTRLAAENRQLTEARRENDQLTALLDLKSGFQYATVAAPVIAAESSSQRRVITIGNGTNDDIAMGDVVIARGGALVGRVTEVGSNFANVRLMTDPASIVTGQLPNAATGDVVGDLGGVVVMNRIDATQQVHVGDAVVTAGLSVRGVRSPYPKGLVIGDVVDVRRDPNAVVQTAWLAPAAPIDRLEYVLVITDYEGGLAPP